MEIAHSAKPFPFRRRERDEKKEGEKEHSPNREHFGWHFISWMMNMQNACMSTLQITFRFESILNGITCDHWLDKCDGVGRRNSRYIHIIHACVLESSLVSDKITAHSELEWVLPEQTKRASSTAAIDRHSENGKEIRSVESKVSVFEFDWQMSTRWKKVQWSHYHPDVTLRKKIATISVAKPFTLSTGNRKSKFKSISYIDWH